MGRLSNRMTSTVDEEIIRKRLLLDGEGAGDDRKLTMILKSFLKWCNNPEPDNASYQKILYLLDQAEYQIKKLELVAKANHAQQQKYAQIEQEIESEMEYDALARIINKNKDRKTTQDQIDEVQGQTDALLKENQALDKKLSDRRRELHVLLQSIHGIESKLKQEELITEGQAMEE